MPDLLSQRGPGRVSSRVQACAAARKCRLHGSIEPACPLLKYFMLHACPTSLVYISKECCCQKGLKAGLPSSFEAVLSNHSATSNSPQRQEAIQKGCPKATFAQLQARVKGGLPGSDRAALQRQRTEDVVPRFDSTYGRPKQGKKSPVSPPLVPRLNTADMRRQQRLSPRSPGRSPTSQAGGALGGRSPSAATLQSPVSHDGSRTQPFSPKIKASRW